MHRLGALVSTNNPISIDPKVDLQPLLPDVKILRSFDTAAGDSSHWLGLAPPASYKSTLLMADQPRDCESRMWCHLPASISKVTVYRHCVSHGIVVLGVEFHVTKSESTEMTSTLLGFRPMDMRDAVYQCLEEGERITVIGIQRKLSSQWWEKEEAHRTGLDNVRVWDHEQTI